MVDWKKKKKTQLKLGQRETETVHFMQVVPWLGVVPNKAGQLQQLLCDDNYSPLVSLFKEATNEILTNPSSTLNANSFLSMSKQAEVVGKVNFFNNPFFECNFNSCSLSLSLSLSLFLPQNFISDFLSCVSFDLAYFSGFKVLGFKVACSI
jgi:hypothetical protein